MNRQLHMYKQIFIITEQLLHKGLHLFNMCWYKYSHKTHNINKIKTILKIVSELQLCYHIDSIFLSFFHIQCYALFLHDIDMETFNTCNCFHYTGIFLNQLYTKNIQFKSQIDLDHSIYAHLTANHTNH